MSEKWIEIKKDYDGKFIWRLIEAYPDQPQSVRSGSGTGFVTVKEAQASAIARFGRLRFQPGYDPEAYPECVSWARC